MSSSLRSLLLHPRPLRSLAPAARRAYATIPTKNPNPTVPIEPSREQAMPIGSFYEAILNTPQPIPDVKPEEPASSVKEHLQQQEAAADEAETPAKEPAKRGRKPKPVKEAATAAAKTSVSSSSPPAAGADAGDAGGAGASSSSSSSAADLTAPPSSSSSPPAPTPPPTEESTQDKAKVIFGSRLAGPAERAERLAQIRARSSVVAGVLVPPRPEEPDNCCMSGCVNCVWDRFRDEMEAWVVANAEAERRKMEVAGEGSSSGERIGTETGKDRAQGDVGASATTAAAVKPVLDHTTVSMDDDGGGSETNWNGAAAPSTEKIAKDLWDEELYKNVPVGIREFMKQEKKLKEKHLREGTSGG